MDQINLALDYRQNQCFYSIYRTKQNQIAIDIYDVGLNRTSKVAIDSDMLRHHSMTISELGNHIYKQSVFQGTKKRRLIQHDDYSITLSFTYPKCSVKPITFKTNWQKNQGSQSEKILAKIQQVLDNVDKRCLHFSKRFESQVEYKLGTAMKTLSSHADHLIQRLSRQFQQKNLEFCMLLSQGKVQQQQQYKIIMRDTVNKILDSNLRYFDQFKLVETNLQTDILTCDQNIKEISMQVNDLRNFMMAQHEKMEDQVIKASEELKDFQEMVQYKFKEIRAILQERLPDEVDLKKYVAGQSIEKDITYMSTDKSTTELKLLDDKDSNKEETTLLPILDGQSLSQFPLKQKLSEGAYQ